MHQSAVSTGAPARIVVIDRDADAGRDLIGALRDMLPEADARAACSGRQGMEALRRAGCDLLLVDSASALDLAPNEQEALGRLARCAGGALVVVLSNGGSISAAMDAMRSGAHEFVARPVDRADFLGRVAALARRHGRHNLMPRGSAWLGGEPAMPPVRVVRGAGPEAPVLPMWRQEQRIIEDAIRHFSGNITMAAAALELSPSTIYRKRQAWAEMDLKTA